MLRLKCPIACEVHCIKFKNDIFQYICANISSMKFLYQFGSIIIRMLLFKTNTMQKQSHILHQRNVCVKYASVFSMDGFRGE